MTGGLTIRGAATRIVDRDDCRSGAVNELEDLITVQTPLELHAPPILDEGDVKPFRAPSTHAEPPCHGAKECRTWAPLAMLE
jgi:hypothetical protein